MESTYHRKHFLLNYFFCIKWNNFQNETEEKPSKMDWIKCVRRRQQMRKRILRLMMMEATHFSFFVLILLCPFVTQAIIISLHALLFHFYVSTSPENTKVLFYRSIWQIVFLVIFHCIFKPIQILQNEYKTMLFLQLSI